MRRFLRELLPTWADRICYGAVLASIVLSCTQWDLRPLFGVRLSLVDPLLVLAAFCWLVRVLARGEWWRKSWILPWQVAFFVLFALLSLFAVARDGMGEALRELLKVVEYLVVGHILYDDFLRRHPQRLRLVLYLLLGVTVAMILLSLWQFFFNPGDPVRTVCGSFKSRNVLGGWLAMMLPMVFGVALYATSMVVRVSLWLLLVCGLLVLLSAAALGAVLIAMLLIAATRGWRTFVPAALAATFWVAVVTDHIGPLQDAETGLPQTSQQVLFRSVALYNHDSQPERRYPQWQSAMEMIMTHPWLGVGIGNYQRSVVQYTGTMPRPTGPSEPDIQNLYLVIGSSMGLPALFAFLAMLLAPAFMAGVAAHRYGGWRRGLVYGLAGGLAAFAITAIWHPLLVRGIGLTLVLLMVVARLVSEWSFGQAQNVFPDAGKRQPEESDGVRTGQRHRRRWRNPMRATSGFAVGSGSRRP